MVDWVCCVSYRAGSDADNLNRLDAIKDDSTPQQMLAQYTYVGLGTIVIEDYPQPQVRLDYWRNDQGSGTSGTYVGFDRFDRVLNHKWYDYGASAMRDQYTYGYDRASNRLYRENTGSSGKDELYTYDGMNQLVTADRGDLNTPPTSLTNKNFAQQWKTDQEAGLDPTGNWKHFWQDDNGDGTWDLKQQRDHNHVNEIDVDDNHANAAGASITATTGSNWVDPTHDAAGPLDVGLLGETDGYDFQGSLLVGPYMVGLKDADRAKVYEGVTMAGGTLASFNGIELQSGTIPAPTVSGYGTIAGAVRLVNTVIRGTSSSQMIVLPGVVTGKAMLLQNVALTGLSRLGASPIYIPMSGQLGSAEMEIWGARPHVVPIQNPFEPLGEYSQFGAIGPLSLGGDLTVKLMGGFHPSAQNQFGMFESLTIPEYGMDGYYTGWFSKVTLPAEMQGWYWVYGLADGSTSLQVPTGPYETATLMIPEPGTLVLLAIGGLMLLARAHRIGAVFTGNKAAER